MSRTIADLTPGVGVWIDETVSGTTSHVEYIYLGLDGSGNARLLRKYVAAQKRMNATNVAHYDGCEADLWHENEETGFLARFDAATINALQPTTMCCDDYTTSADGTVEHIDLVRRCAPLSYKEFGFGGSETDVSFLEALKTYYNTTNANTAKIGRTKDETAVNVWMRSGYSASKFRYVLSNGFANGGATSGNYWQRPAISVAPATIVSDEGADSIFLLPDGRRTTWSIRAAVKMGQSAARPKKAKLMVAESAIASASYKVSNNAGDESPVWVACANGGVCNLANTEKTTDAWELGVLIEAESGVHNGYVGEPVLVVETEGS